jgi:hypothetical protein
VTVGIRLLRAMEAALAIVVCAVLTLHVSIVAAYGAAGSPEGLGAVALGLAIVVSLIAMCTLGRPSSLLVRTAVCPGLASGYVVVRHVRQPDPRDLQANYRCDEFRGARSSNQS